MALIDGIAILNFSFLSGRAPACQRTADVDGNGVVDGLIDSLCLLNFLFLPGSPAPALPFPGCGVDPSPPSPCPLSCIEYECP